MKDTLEQSHNPEKRSYQPDSGKLDHQDRQMFEKIRANGNFESIQEQAQKSLKEALKNEKSRFIQTEYHLTDDQTHMIYKKQEELEEALKLIKKPYESWNGASRKDQKCALNALTNAFDNYCSSKGGSTFERGETSNSGAYPPNSDLGPEHPSTADTLDQFDIVSKLGRAEETLWKERDNILSEVAGILNRFVSLYEEWRDTPSAFPPKLNASERKAREAWGKRLNIPEQSEDTENELRQRAEQTMRSKLDVIQTFRGKYNEAQESLSEHTHSHGQHLDEGVNLHMGVRWYPAIKGQLQTVLYSRIDNFTRNHIKIVQTLDQLGTLHMQQGNFDLAKQKLAKELDIRKFYEELVDFEISENFVYKNYEERFAQYKQQNFLNIVDTLHQLGTLHMQQGKFDLAETNLCEALGIQDKPQDHLKTADILHELGTLHMQQGKFDLAEQTLCEALVIQDKSQDHLKTADTLHELGIVSEKLGKDKEAQKYLEREFCIRRKLKPDFPNTLSDVDSLLNVYKKLENYSEAAGLLAVGLAAAEEKFGLASDQARDNLKRVIQFHMDQNNSENARQVLENAINRRKNMLGPNAPATKEVEALKHQQDLSQLPFFQDELPAASREKRPRPKRTPKVSSQKLEAEKTDHQGELRPKAAPLPDNQRSQVTLPKNIERSLSFKKPNEAQESLSEQPQHQNVILPPESPRETPQDGSHRAKKVLAMKLFKLNNLRKIWRRRSAGQDIGGKD